MSRVTARHLDAALAAAVAAPGLVATAWSGPAGPGRPWAALVLIGVTAALMFLRRTRPALAAAVMAAAYVAAVQAGGVSPHGSSPASNAAVVSTGIAAAALSYALGGSARLPASLAGRGSNAHSRPLPARTGTGPDSGQADRHQERDRV